MWLPTQRATQRSHADNCFSLQREFTGIAEKYHMSLGSVSNEGNFVLMAWAWSLVRGVINSVGVTN